MKAPPLVRRSRKPRIHQAIAASAVAIACAVVGCDRLLAIDGLVTVAAEAGAPSFPACGIASATQACQACLEESCCAEATACAKTGACGGYESCLVPCGGDYVCRARCEAANQGPEVAAERPAFDQCLVANCEAACGVQSGLVSTHAEPAAAVACLACLETNGLAQAEACGRDIDCTWLEDCIESCPTGDCITACFIGRDAGVATTFVAAASSCWSTCSSGAYWECVGREPAPPFTKSATNVVAATIYDDTSQRLVQGATLKACQIDGVTCNTTLASGATDADGNVSISIPVEPGSPYGFDGYLDVSGPSLYPALVFQMFPLVEPESRATLLSLTIYEPSTWADRYTAAGRTMDPSRGEVVVVTTDCHWAIAPDVQVEATGLDDASTRYYPVDNAFSATSTATDKSGQAIFLGVPAGPITISATSPALGRALGSRTIIVRPAALSFLWMHPNQ